MVLKVSSKSRKFHSYYEAQFVRFEFAEPENVNIYLDNQGIKSEEVKVSFKENTITLFNNIGVQINEI